MDGGRLAGVFLALDLFLFYFFFEMMLVPMYFLIALWGHERRVLRGHQVLHLHAGGGLLMLIAIVALYFIHGRADRRATPSTSRSCSARRCRPARRMLLMLGFFAAFAVKLPAVPLHTWLPDAHTEAPTAG